MKHEPKPAVPARHFRLIHQQLSVSRISFERRSLFGAVQLSIIPLYRQLRELILNCRQAAIVRITVNDHESTFVYEDPLLSLCDNDKRRSFDAFNESHLQANDVACADKGHGQLHISLPELVWPTVEGLKLLTIEIEFSVENPAFGVQFVVPLDSNKDAYMFTYKHGFASCLWFPCVDSLNEVCPWRVDITVDHALTAVVSGELLACVYTTDMLQKTWHYQIQTPTSAANVGFAIGPFQLVVHPEMHELSHFCLPAVKALIKCSTTSLHKAFEFFEEFLSSRYPHTTYKQVFVDQTPADITVYSSLCILSVNLLHHKKIIDQVATSRTLMADAVSQQFYGTFVAAQSWLESWVISGISSYITGLFVQRFFGNNEYLFQLKQYAEDVCGFENKYGGIVLAPRQVKRKLQIPSSHHCGMSLAASACCSPLYAEMHRKKAHLAIRMLEKKLGKELLTQVLSKILAAAAHASEQKFAPVAWNALILSTNTFFKCISDVTGQDCETFLEQWIHSSGHAEFEVRFSFSRKRNMMELEIRQEPDAKTGIMLYLGSLSISIQELDGAFTHQLQIDEAISKHDIQCHSKSRKQKRKKIPIWTGQEIEMDLSGADPDSPILWIRIDPELLTIRSMRLYQPDTLWQFELKHEKDVIAQLQAVSSLQQFATLPTKACLAEVIKNSQHFYRVRVTACHVLAQVEQKLINQIWNDPPSLIGIFQELFGSESCSRIVRLNNFANFQSYFLQQAIPLALSKLRNNEGIALPDVIDFLLDLLKYNDNSQNKYSDDTYRAVLIDALINTITQTQSRILSTSEDQSNVHVSEQMRRIAEEVALQMNIETLKPSYRRTVPAKCLKAIRQLQKCDYSAEEATPFLAYASASSQFVELRLAAVACLVDFVKSTQDFIAMKKILELIELSPDSYFRYHAAVCLERHAPFPLKDADAECLANQLWAMMCSKFPGDSRLRCCLADVYFAQFGSSRPTCIRLPELGVIVNLKERKCLSGAAMRDAAAESSASSFTTDDLIRRPYFADSRSSGRPEFGILPKLEQGVSAFASRAELPPSLVSMASSLPTIRSSIDLQISDVSSDDD